MGYILRASSDFQGNVQETEGLHLIWQRYTDFCTDDNKRQECNNLPDMKFIRFQILETFLSCNSLIQVNTDEYKQFFNWEYQIPAFFPCQFFSWRLMNRYN